ncbi:hypothetical protein FOZ63_021729 [Perkinsus olseni]|uniref:Protein kinase domain-containing protein n=1 Tax=Perkinsus olseni TaxID=32597 RepID=A0A7J6T6S0_PEROL|nr:hypothetical protein FOZ62_009218 [Perkinsus olseni]KAF4740126.1 hypothetical protein FOZ63_021729 [Perkinsus olseni]
MSLASASTASAGSSWRNPNDPRTHHQLVLHQPIRQQQMHSLPECISAVPLELPGPIGRRFSLYPSVEQCILGSGSYAIVRQLKDRETGEYYALKAVQKQPLIDRGMLDRVYNEIATHQELKHENILTLYGYYEDTTHIYMQLELATGGVLADWQARCFPPYGRVAERQAAIIFRQILSAVDHLHHRNIAHRDLKTANILMLAPYGATDTGISIRLCDFGWSTRCDGEADSGDEKQMVSPEESPSGGGSVNRRRTLCGTVDSMPPEMLMGAPHGLPCDRWALGCLLYALLVGHSPYAVHQGSHHPAAVRDRILTSRGVPYPPGVASSAARDMVHRFMQLNPKARLHASTALDHGWIQKHHSVSRDASSLSSISEDEIVECDQQQQQQPPLWRSEVTRRVSAPLGQLSPRTTLLSQRQVAVASSHHLPSQAILPPMAGPPPQRSPREGRKVALEAPSLPPFSTTVTAADLAKFPPPLQQQLPAAHPATCTVAGHPPAALMPLYWPANRNFFF